MKAEILNHFSWAVNKMSENYISKSRSAEFKETELNKTFEFFYKSISEHIDLNNLTTTEARELRFNKWEEGSDLWLFPLWLVPIIPEGLEVTTINGKTKKYKKDEMDNDVRFGCVAYGINIKE